nr:MAG TPA: hypothetical protein [Caudoviricetes sp.]
MQDGLRGAFCLLLISLFCFLHISIIKSRDLRSRIVYLSKRKGLVLWPAGIKADVRKMSVSET